MPVFRANSISLLEKQQRNSSETTAKQQQNSGEARTVRMYCAGTSQAAVKRTIVFVACSVA